MSKLNFYSYRSKQFYTSSPFWVLFDWFYVNLSAIADRLDLDITISFVAITTVLIFLTFLIKCHKTLIKL